MTDRAADHVLKAGHCGPAGPEWFAGGRPVGATAAGGFPGDDCSLVEYAVAVRATARACGSPAPVRSPWGGGCSAAAVRPVCAAAG
ncbi:hypothetical protein GCM10010240_09020 [Streptomyces griseoviridis]|nr:hypothetical protein GCM10010240_09020 [Streptomyces griseoviridis]